MKGQLLDNPVCFIYTFYAFNVHLTFLSVRRIMFTYKWGFPSYFTFVDLNLRAAC